MIPARSFGLDSVTLSPRKLATISVFDREIVLHSTPAIEKIVGLALIEFAAVALDKAMLDASAASASRPQGMRFGIAASPTSAKTVRTEAMAEDIATLVTAVAPIAGNYPIFLVAAPAQAAALRLWYKPNVNYQIIATGQLANGTVLAISSNCVVSAIDPQPRIDQRPKAPSRCWMMPCRRNLAQRRILSRHRQFRFFNLIGWRCAWSMSAVGRCATTAV